MSRHIVFLIDFMWQHGETPLAVAMMAGDKSEIVAEFLAVGDVLLITVTVGGP